MKKKTTLFICLIFHLLAFPGLLSAETGSEINIAIKEFPPFVFKELKGFCIDMANIICKKNNLTPKFVRYKSVPEVLAAVESGECHMAFSGITITANREKRVDFSQPFFDSGLSIAVRTEPSSGLAGTYITILKVIGYSVILFLIGLTIVAHIIWFIEKNDSDPKSFPTSYGKGILDAYWWSVVTMTTVGYGDKCPKKVSGRVIASIWMIIGIIWFAGFTATLSSSLTVEKIEHGEIKSLSDLNNKRVSVIRGTTSENYLRYHNVKMHLSENLDDLIGNLKNQNVDAVVYDAPALMYISKNDPSIKVVGDMFDKQRYGIVFPQNGNNIYKELFNIAIIDMQRSGEYQKIYNKWF
jgi:polar amino acid transport system substrate-binding protein